MTSGRAARIWQFALPPLTIVAVVVAWEALVRLRGIAPIYLPAPSSVFVYLSRMIADGSMPIISASPCCASSSGLASRPCSGSHSAY